MKFKNILKKFDDKFDAFFDKAENKKPIDIVKREEHIEKLKKKLKKLEKFIKGKLKSFDIYQIEIKEINLKQRICYSTEKGFYFAGGKHKNFSLRQSLGLFKTNESYMEAAEGIISNTEKVLDGILKDLSLKMSKIS